MNICSSFSNSYGVKKSACLSENRLCVFEQKSPMERSQSPKMYIVRHSNIVLSFVLSSHMNCLTNENTVLLYDVRYIFALWNCSIYKVSSGNG